MISTAADVAGMRSVWCGRSVFMTSGVAVRLNLRGCDAGRPNMHETCNKSAATAANAATLTLNWTIERMPMRSSQNQGNNVNSIVSLRLLALHKSSVLSS